DSGDGVDTIRVLRTTGRLTVDVQGNPVGGDQVFVGNAGSLQSIRAPLSFTASDRLGFYELFLDDSADPTARTATLDNGTFVGLSPAPISTSSAGFDPVLNVNAGSGGNTFTVHSFGNELFLNGGTGNDTVTFTGADGTLDNLTGDLVFS